MATFEDVEQVIEAARAQPECFKCREPITELEDVRIITVRVDGEPIQVWAHAAHSTP